MHGEKEEMAITLKLEKREDKRGRQLVSSGKTPCVILKQDSTESYQVDTVELRKAIVSMNGKVLPLVLDVEGKEVKAYLKDLQRNALGDVILHADFFEVVAGREFVLNVPVVVTGVAKGVQSGGKLKKRGYDLKVAADSTSFPDSITIDVTSLELGQKIKVKDIALEGARILDAPDRALVAVASK